jgi:hypothetical protein
VTRLAELQLRRAALRIEMAAARGEAADSCSALRTQLGGAMLGVSIGRIASAAPLRWRIGLLAGLAAVSAARALLRR